MEAIYTIGVYGFDADTFLATLRSAGIDCLIDLRRRRGVRGSEYAFANSQRLQRALAENGIRYLHAIELAPDPEIRAAQYAIDARAGIPKRQRDSLSNEFVAAYTERALRPFDWTSLVAAIGNARRPVLLCVERTAIACHRGLVATELSRRQDVPVVNLTP